MKAVATYLAVAAAWSWGILAWFRMEGGTFGTPTSFGVALAYMWGPGLGAIVAQHFVVKKHVPTGLGLKIDSRVWLVGAWLLAPVLALAMLGLSAVLPETRVSFHLPELFEAHLPEMLGQSAHKISAEQIEAARKQAAETSGLLAFGSQFTGAMLFGAFFRAFVTLGEELGWRGFLLKEFARFGFWGASLLIGLLWGLWYAPLVLFGHNYPQHPQQGVAMMLAFTLIASPLVTYLRLRAGSVAGAALFLGTLQAASAVVISFTIGGSDLTRGLFGLPGLVVLLAATLVLVPRGLPQAREALAKLRDT